MKNFSEEILAYALQNAIEFGKADASKILPKLFQHGLKKEEIKIVIPIIQEIVKKVNSKRTEERLKEFENVKDFVKKRIYEEKKLEELPKSDVKGKMTFRLAPFPSGALHIGNAKTYVLNALYAESYDGDIILVMDDTIGSAEKPLIKEGYKLIEDAFKWLNVDYKKPIIYKSDRLRIYYQHAEKLIKKEKAYVCHCSQELMRENRENGVECGCRQFPSKIQLLRWKEMFKLGEGEATLRIKTDMQDPNPAFRDRVLFKISDRKHPRVENKYRVWPSLEMSWAIDDHLLGITHIIRGNDLMIETLMEKYIWDIFKWKHPITIHTGLIKIEFEGAKISKSKAQKEVLSGEFIGWDDPRTWSVQSLERRGIRKEAIREFVKEIGLNKQDIIVPIDSLYSINRKLLDEKALRYSFVANPVKIEIKDKLPFKEVEVPVHPDKHDEIRKISVANNIFISEEDFKKYGGKEIRLLHLFNVKLKDKTKISSIENKNIQKINWVCDRVEARVLMPSGNWIEGVAEKSIEELNVGSIIQFERFGFCRFDGKKKINENYVYEFWLAHR